MTGPDGTRIDFPHAFDWKLSTSQKTFVASRAFNKSGTYTYWFSYRHGSRWVSLNPKLSFAVGDLSASGTPTPSPTTTLSATPTAAPTPTATATPTSTPTSTAAPAGWPGATNTGVPAGTALITYTGPMTITVANTVIDAKVVNGSLTIAAPGVVVSRSKVYGSVSNGSVASHPSFTVRDSEVIAGAGQTNIGDANFVVERSNLYGGNRAVYAESHGTVRDSWIHGTGSILVATRVGYPAWPVHHAVSQHDRLRRGSHARGRWMLSAHYGLPGLRADPPQHRGA